ncbi:MAG: PaaX family transcriptional regulator C-terminal domain-containing protein [Betaproteobacteria bacterium]
MIVTVWGDALVPHGGEAWLATLIGLLAGFGINERSVRTAVFRLARDGWLAAESRGRRSRYKVTAAGAARFAHAFHRVYDAPFEPWNGEWEAVVVHGDRVGPAMRRHLRDELGWAGFALLAPGVYLRPARDDGAATRIVDALDAARWVTGFAARDSANAASSGLAARAEGAYALEALAGDYRRFLARYSGVADALARRVRPTPDQAFAIRTLLVHAYRRVRLRDPQLPRAVLGTDWPGGPAYTLCQAIHRATHARSEAHLASIAASEGDAWAPIAKAHSRRFSETIRQ